MTTGAIATLITIIIGVATIIGVIIKCFKWAVDKIKQDYKKQLESECELASLNEMLRKLEIDCAGTKALLRYRLRIEMKTAMDKGYTTETEYADIREMFNAYKDLGGNGVISHLYEDYHELPMR